MAPHGPGHLGDRLLYQEARPCTRAPMSSAVAAAGSTTTTTPRACGREREHAQAGVLERDDPFLAVTVYNIDVEDDDTCFVDDDGPWLQHAS